MFSYFQRWASNFQSLQIANPEILGLICKEKEYGMYLRTVLNPQITNKIRSANRKIRKVPHLRKVCKSANYLNPQICGFAIRRIYLRTSHVRLLYYGS
jgi:hypothetical protein